MVPSGSQTSKEVLALNEAHHHFCHIPYSVRYEQFFWQFTIICLYLPESVVNHYPAKKNFDNVQLFFYPYNHVIYGNHIPHLQRFPFQLSIPFLQRWLLCSLFAAILAATTSPFSSCSDDRLKVGNTAVGSLVPSRKKVEIAPFFLVDKSSANIRTSEYLSPFHSPLSFRNIHLLSHFPLLFGFPFSSLLSLLLFSRGGRRVWFTL